jgi:hypothetical protein
MGYLINDDRVSGGLLEECDTTWCRHCQWPVRIVKEHGVRKGFVCMKCAGLICVACAAKETCEPFFAKVDRWQRERARRRALGLA